MNLFLINSIYLALKPSSATRSYAALSLVLQLVLLSWIICIEMPLHGAIVCDLQYLYEILALYMLEIFTFFDVLLYCVPTTFHSPNHQGL